MNNSDPSGMSASGCAGTPVMSGTWGQCIGIAGSGNWVQQIKSSYYASDSGCSVAQILVNGVVILQAPEVCYTVATGQPTVLDGRHLSAEWGCSDQQINTGSCSGVLNSNGTSPFKAGDKVCEQYTGTGISGNPNFNGYSLGACETIGNPNQIPYSPARNQPPVPNPLPPLQGFSGGTNLSPMPAPPTPQFAPVGDFSYTNCASTIKFT